MSIETDLIDYLLANTSGIEYVLDLAMPDATPPFVEITVQDDRRTRLTKGTQPTRVAELEFECWNRNHVLARQTAHVIIDLLQDFTGYLDQSSPAVNSQVMATQIYNEFGGSDSAAELFYRNFTVRFSYR